MLNLTWIYNDWKFGINTFNKRWSDWRKKCNNKGSCKGTRTKT
jgi:hypothetical protein